MDAKTPDEFLELMAAKFRLLGDATRLAILRELMAGERSVSEVVEVTGAGQANVSKHLKLLCDAGLLARRRQGTSVFYRVCDPLVEQLCRLACATVAAEAGRELERQQQLLRRWNESSGEPGS